MSYRRGGATNCDFDAEYDSQLLSPALPHFPPHQPLPTMYNPVPSHGAGRRPAPPEASAIDQKLDQMMGMISDTQGMLMNQVTTSKKLEKVVDEMSTKITTLKKELDEVKENNNNTRMTTGKRCKLPTQLSANIKKLHDNAAEDTRFDGRESYSSPQNEKVKDYLMNELERQFADKYAADVLKRGIHRYYESRRRIINDKKPHRISKVAENKRKAQKVAFQKRLYERRQKSLRNDDERRKWLSISHVYMTEESESDEDTVRQHKLIWRSDELNKLVKVLDKRAKKADTGTGRFSAKNRVVSTESTSTPPPSSPPWSTKVMHTAPTTAPSSVNTTPSGPPSSGIIRRRALITSQQALEEMNSSSSDEN